MTLAIDILNEARARLGETALQSETAPGADVDLMIYKSMVTFALGQAQWTFATGFRQLGTETVPNLPAFWTYAYMLPEDRVGAPLSVFDTLDRDRPITDFELAGAHLLTNAPLIIVRYRKFAQPANWSPFFKEAVIVLIMAEFALAHLEDPGQRNNLRREALGDPRTPGSHGLIHTARTEDMQARPSPVLALDGGPLIEARYSGYGARRNIPQ